MAESIADFLDVHPEVEVFVHFNGAFHSDYRLGTAGRLATLRAHLKTVVLSAVPCPDPALASPSGVEAGMADVVVFVPMPGAETVAAGEAIVGMEAAGFRLRASGVW